MMNWLDIVFIGLVAIGALRGYRIGLLSVAVNTLALIWGWLLASQVAYALGLFGGSFEWSSASVIFIVVYVVVIAVTVTVVQLGWKKISKSLGVVTLGAYSLIDRIGGLLLGMVLGCVLAAALVLCIAWITYDVPLGNVNTPIASDEVREGLETTLTESVAVRVFVEETEGLSFGAIRYITPGFAELLETLRRRT